MRGVTNGHGPHDLAAVRFGPIIDIDPPRPVQLLPGPTDWISSVRLVRHSFLRSRADYDDGTIWPARADAVLEQPAPFSVVFVIDDHGIWQAFLGLLDGWPVDLRRLVTAERRVAFGKTVRALLAENGATR